MGLAGPPQDPDRASELESKVGLVKGPRRKGPPESVGAVVDRAFRRLACGRPLSAAVATAWRRAVGERVARRALPVRQRGDTLFVRVATSSWLHELQMLTPNILESLQKEEACSRIRRIHPGCPATPARD